MEASAFSKAWVRFGIFSGVVVCGWYMFAFLLEHDDSGPHCVNWSSSFGAAIWLLAVRRCDVG